MFDLQPKIYLCVILNLTFYMMCCIFFECVIYFIKTQSNGSFLLSEIYRQKLQQCVADGELSEEDVKALLRLRVMLCIPQQTVEAAHADICGSLFEKVMFHFYCLICW